MGCLDVRRSPGAVYVQGLYAWWHTFLSLFLHTVLLRTTETGLRGTLCSLPALDVIGIVISLGARGSDKRNENLPQRPGYNFC